MRSKLRIAVVAAVVAVAMAAVGCKSHHCGAVVADIAPHGWHDGQSVALDYRNTDTLSHYDVWVVARMEHSNKRNQVVVVEVECVSPDSLLRGSSELVLVPQATEGGSFVEARALWVRDARLAQQGTYSIGLKNRSGQTLEGLWTVGVDFVPAGSNPHNKARESKAKL